MVDLAAKRLRSRINRSHLIDIPSGSVLSSTSITIAFEVKTGSRCLKKSIPILNELKLIAIRSAQPAGGMVQIFPGLCLDAASSQWG
jgi:hypothetical protein